MRFQPINMIRQGWNIRGNDQWNAACAQAVSHLTGGPGQNNDQVTAFLCRLKTTFLTGAGGKFNQNLALQMLDDIWAGLANAGVPASQINSVQVTIDQFCKGGPGPRQPMPRPQYAPPPRPMYARPAQPQAPMQPVPLMRMPPPPFSPPVQRVTSVPAPQAPGMPIVIRQLPTPQTVVVQQAPWQPPPMPQNWAPPAPPPPAWAPPPPPVAVTPAQVISVGSKNMQNQAWMLVQRIASGDAGAIAYLAQQRQLAIQGDWNARQFLTFAQSAFQQIGQDPTPARWAGDNEYGMGAAPADGPYTFQDWTDALVLVNRARAFDQNAIATLNTLGQGGPRARRIYRCVQRVLANEPPPAFGAGKHGKSKGGRAHHAPPAPVRHPAIVAAKKPAHHTPVRHGGTAGAASTGQASAEGGMSPTAGGDGMQGLGDEGLDVRTGQPSHPEAAAIVNAARAGNPAAVQKIQETMRAYNAGDPRARHLAEGIIAYTQGRPEFAGEVQRGHVVNLSHSHPLTQRRVQRIGKDIAATFGAEGERIYMAHVNRPHGPVAPIENVPAWTGQIVGKAQHIQAARFPEGRVRFVSQRAARELGE